MAATAAQPGLTRARGFHVVLPPSTSTSTSISSLKLRGIRGARRDAALALSVHSQRPGFRSRSFAGGWSVHVCIRHYHRTHAYHDARHLLGNLSLVYTIAAHAAHSHTQTHAALRELGLAMRIMRSIARSVVSIIRLV